MKTKLNLFIYFMAIALMLGSCNEETLDDLSDIYTPPEIIDYTVLHSQSREKDGSLFVFSINLSDNASNTLNLKLAAAAYALPESDFTASETIAAKTYLTGNNGSTCNGQQFTGTISVTVVGSDYSLEGILYLADETVVRMTGSFSFEYEYIPFYSYSIETETPAISTDGFTEITGTTKHKISVYSDGVAYAYLEVIANETATSLDGTYTIKDGTDAAGQVANGYYMDFSWWNYGTDIVQGGSYYIENGESMWLREADEDVITISEDGNLLNITGENLGILDLEALAADYTAWQNLEELGNFDITDADEAVSNIISATAADYTSYGGNFVIALKITTSGVTYDGSAYTGNGNVITLEFQRDNTTLIAGTYNMVDYSSVAVGDCTAGYVDPYFGTGALWGSVWSTVVDGVITDVAINSGTVEVIVEDDNYIIIVNVTTDDGSVKTTYTGPITISK